MAGLKPRYSKEEFARRGEEIFERVVKPQCAGKEPHAFVAIDIESEAFEIDNDELAAGDRLRARHPDAQIWMRRVGSPFARRFGATSRREWFCGGSKSKGSGEKRFS